MEKMRVLTRTNELTYELTEIVERVYKGVHLSYEEFYYLDYEVDEDSGMVNKEKKVKHYTKNQMDRNIKALKNSYHIAKGSASPTEIINYRKRFHISASTFSVILGFSKNTISNIENEGITSLSSGRLIKLCLDNRETMITYLKLCDTIDEEKKEELSKRLLEEIY
ncbi:helix-turn-helix domain-containing protein [Flavobacterium silvaticum]|uniref:Transcriptional regulator n=1 Tax=Flavobacterium silvaticum TaxID=1852020 RepID=A0A972FT49_9FLAO|nr:helix-turn-helix domain-containing protein [Flavobacterium silvaticum]NMH27998.1 transcriptional regulator [Flavobacterium silvaticum]